MGVSIGAMFDPTILLHLQPAMPPARPEFVVERRAASPAGVFQRIADQKASRYERDIDARRGDRIILRKDAEDLFAAVDYGPHDNVYRRWDRRK